MPIEITMPALSPTMEEGKLAKWLVNEGDQVQSGDVIAEIETDKATMEVEAVDEGTIAKLVIDAGTEGVKVNSIIALLAEEGEDASAISSAAPQASPTPVAAKSPMDTHEKGQAEASDTKGVTPKGDLSQEYKNKTDSTSNGNRVFASPLARRIASQKGIDLAAIQGSGPHGRIIKVDVEGLTAGQAPVHVPAGGGMAGMSTASPSAVAGGLSDEQVLAFYQEGEYERLEHNSMRKVIASRLTESSQTIPSYNLTMDCELDVLLAVRKTINDGAPIGDDEKPEYKLSVNDFIIKAMAMALRDVPLANASWTSSARVLHKHSDVGVAVAIPDGLITPIVRKAELKTLSAISNEMKDLAGRARNLRLKPEEYQGGTTAVSNLGMFGVTNFTSIINPPQASIISIGAGEKRAIVKDGQLVAATMMNVTFAFDHRVIDGALGAQLAVAFRKYIQNPVNMLV